MTVTATPDAIAPIEASIEIAAPPARVWELISDLRNMRQWSPQNLRTVLLGPNRPGTRFVNLNHSGWKVWPSWGTLVDLTPGKRIAWRMDSNLTVWSIDLHELPDGGTGVVQRREAPEGIGAVAGALTKVALGGQEMFTAELEDGMAETLAAIKYDVERRG